MSALFRLSVDGWLVSTGKSLNHKVFSKFDMVGELRGISSLVRA